MAAPLIRHGTVARLRGRLMPSSATAFGPDAIDVLEFEMKVLTGRYRGSHFWEFLPVDTTLGRTAYGYMATSSANARLRAGAQPSRYVSADKTEARRIKYSLLRSD